MQTQNNTEAPIEQWAIVEIFGHQRIAGRISEHTIGGCAFVRVDVPPIEQANGQAPIPGFTKLYGNGAIYAITFVDEITARSTAAGLKLQPVGVWDLREALEAVAPGKLQQLGYRRVDSTVAGDTDPDDERPY